MLMAVAAGIAAKAPAEIVIFAGVSPLRIIASTPLLSLSEY